MRTPWTVLALGFVLGACSPMALMPDGCNEFAAPAGRVTSCELRNWAIGPGKGRTPGPELSCQRTLGGVVECQEAP